MKKIYTRSVCLSICFFSALLSQIEKPLGPGPLFTFGQNILPQGFLIGNIGYEYFGQKHGFISAAFLEFLYGITNKCALSASFPVILKQKFAGIKSQGLGSIVVQSEYAWYTIFDKAFRYQATIVGSIFLPTATTRIQLSFANKKASFFIGNTQTLSGGDWHAYTAQGVLFPVTKRNVIGLRFRYDLGFGKTLHYRPYVSTLLEMTGLYSPRNEHGQGGVVRRAGNLIFLGPSFRLFVRKILFQAGVQFPLCQTGFEADIQHTVHFACSAAWRF